ncbi:MAG: cellulase family glycosylhydrolase, partial [Verrucomicrobiota bacterium]|nr:cellulase family glycosylhydrolase [Verrucomicrobiota bacterium]
MFRKTVFICSVCVLVCFSALGAEFQKLHVKNGTLYFEDGREAVLWGVNFQPSLSWEYFRMKRHGLHVPFDQKKYQAMIDEAFDEIQRMGSNLIRMHLTPSDIADEQGDLVENEWLDTLDYVMAKAEERGIYVYLAFLNNIGGARRNQSFTTQKEKTKANWMIDPKFMEKADNYIREVLNRRNPYTRRRLYKESPALVIVEPINEPGYFTRDEI